MVKNPTGGPPRLSCMQRVLRTIEEPERRAEEESWRREKIAGEKSRRLDAGGKPSTWFPPGRLVEHIYIEMLL